MKTWTKIIMPNEWYRWGELAIYKLNIFSKWKLHMHTSENALALQ